MNGISLKADLETFLQSLGIVLTPASLEALGEADEMYRVLLRLCPTSRPAVRRLIGVLSFLAVSLSEHQQGAGDPQALAEALLAFVREIIEFRMRVTTGSSGERREADPEPAYLIWAGRKDALAKRLCRLYNVESPLGRLMRSAGGARRNLFG